GKLARAGFADNDRQGIVLLVRGDERRRLRGVNRWKIGARLASCRLCREQLVMRQEVDSPAPRAREQIRERAQLLLFWFGEEPIGGGLDHRIRIAHRYDGAREDTHFDRSGRARVVEDRKSTRLNSSHEWISYAVFCLKKKKQTGVDVI